MLYGFRLQFFPHKPARILLLKSNLRHISCKEYNLIAFKLEVPVSLDGPYLQSLAHKRLKQEDYCEFESLGHIASARSAKDTLAITITNNNKMKGK